MNRMASSAEEQCSGWFLRIEEELDCGSLTFEALQWALESLQAFQDYWASPLSGADQRLHPNDVRPLGTGDDRNHFRRLDDQACPKDASEDEEVLLVDKVRACDMGKAGAIMATVIRDRLSKCSSLVQLIDQCLLLSLDQAKPSCLEQVKNEQGWLHEWMFQHLFSSAAYNLSSNLDWLLAYVSTACPELFFFSLLDIIAAEFRHHSAKQTVVPLSTLVRIASILEYAYFRHGEVATFDYLSSYQLFTECATNVSKTYATSFHKLTNSVNHYLIGVWIVMGFLSPDLFSACVNLLASSSDLASIKKLWLTIREFDFKIIPISKLQAYLTGIDPNKPNDLGGWLCIIFQRHLTQLISAHSDIVLVLSIICVAADEDTDNIVQMAHSLLTILSNRVHINMLQRISGCLPSEAKGSMSSVLENIECQLFNLWGCLINGSALERHAEYSYVYGNPIMDICLLGFLGSPAQIVSEVLVHSMRLVFSPEDNVKLTYKLALLFKVMQSLANNSESAVVFELWSLNVIDQVCLLNSDQVFNKIVVVANLLHLSSGKDLTSGSLSVIQKFNIGPSSSLYYHLSLALNKQWLRLLALLHQNKAFDLQIMVVNILQLLPPRKLSNVQDILCRLKSSLGLLLYWLDEAYCCKANNLNKFSLLGHMPLIQEKWQLIRLIEKFKIVIVDLASLNEMSFTLMVNTILEYSFYETSGSSKLTNCRSKLSVSLPSFSRLNRFGKRLSRPSKCFPIFCFISAAVNKLNIDRFASGISEGSDRTGFCSIISHLANLLRLTASQIDNQAGQTSGKTDINFKPTLVLKKLLMTHHANFQGLKEQYEEASQSFQRTHLSDIFFRNRLVFEILEVICEKGDKNETLECIGILRALLEHTIAYWRDHAAQRSNYNNSLQPGDEESERAYVCRLIYMISKTGGIGSALSASAEIISLIDCKDILDILLLIWSCLCKKAGKLRDILQDTAYADEDSTKDQWESEYHSILRRNVALIGPYFSHLYNNMNL